MGPRISVVVAVSVAVFGVSGGVASARNSHKSRTTQLAVGIETQKLTFVDTGPSGSSPGDMFIEQDNLTRRGKPFGTAQVICIAIAGGLANGSAQCSGTFYLPKGQVETQGSAKSVNGSISGAGAVTGGTRSYRGVRGSYVFHTVTGTTRALRFSLLR
jgi:hypothetical protein